MTEAIVCSRELKIFRSENGTSTLIQCSGRLTTDGVDRFKQEIKSLFPNGKNIILDMGSLIYMDSSGLGAVVGLFVSAKSNHCQLQIYNLSRPVKELFGLTKVLSAFESCGSHLSRLP